MSKTRLTGHGVATKRGRAFGFATWSLATICFVVAISAIVISTKPWGGSMEQGTVAIAASVQSNTLRNTNEEPEFLGDGAFIEWGQDVAEAGIVTDTATVRIHGRKSADIVVTLHVDARLGVIDQPLLDDEFFVAADADVFVPVDLNRARDLHAKQFSYSTGLRASAVTTAVDGKFFISQVLPRKLLVFAEGRSAAEVHDPDSLVKKYPRGITNSAEAARIQSIIDLRNDPEDLNETGAFASGVYDFKPFERKNAASNILATRNVRFCFKTEVLFGDYANGDYWTDPNYDKTAYGIRALVQKNYLGTEIFLDYVDGDTGCTPMLALSTDATYLVRLYTRSKVGNNNVVHVYQSDDPDTYQWGTVSWAFDPDDIAEGGTATMTYPSEDNHSNNILAAASYALRRRPAGLSNHNFYFYALDCPSGGSCHSDGYIYLDMPDANRGRNSKQTITHEMGHLIGWKKDGDQSPSGHSYADIGCITCTSANDDHLIDSREWQRDAAKEGIAHFYGATAWNNKAENDCQWRGFDCAYHHDFLHIVCLGTDEDRGVEGDWLTFWWDVHRTFPLSVADIFDIWGAAAPHDWVDSSVYKRLREAADDFGLDLDYWDDWGRYNGVDEGTWL